MTTQSRWTRTTRCWIVAGLLSVLPWASAQAVGGIGGDARVGRTSRDQLQVTVSAGDPAGQRIALGDRIDRDLMAYHFRLEAVDASGATIALPAGMSLTLRVGALEGGSQMLLSGEGRDLTIPRPWALRLRTEDSLFIVVATGDESAEEVSLRVSIDFEPADRERSRLPITSASAGARPERVSGASTWEWTQVADGRLIAITGLRLERLGAISLVDVESGLVVWSADLGSAIVAAPVPTGARALRFGVPVSAGRTYRLIARRRADESLATPSEHVVAMVLPSAAP